MNKQLNCINKLYQKIYEFNQKILKAWVSRFPFSIYVVGGPRDRRQPELEP